MKNNEEVANIIANIMITWKKINIFQRFLMILSIFFSIIFSIIAHYFKYIVLIVIFIIVFLILKSQI